MAEEEIALILDHLDPSQTMLEWGMGGSTLLFASRVSRYRSIEHDRAWHDRLQPLLHANTLSLLREPAWPYVPYEPADREQFVHSCARHGP